MKRNFLTTIGVVAMFVFTTVLFSCGGTTDTTEADSTKTEVKTEEATPETTTEEATLDLTAGKTVYDAKCSVCHGAEGAGIAGTFPPVAGADYLTKETAIAVALKGLEGENTINGETYSTPMAPVEMTDQEVVDVCNFVLNSFGNSLGTVTLEDVTKAKE